MHGGQRKDLKAHVALRSFLLAVSARDHAHMGSGELHARPARGFPFCDFMAAFLGGID